LGAAHGVRAGRTSAPGCSGSRARDLRNLTLKVYLPEDRFGQVVLGQRAHVSVDSVPGELFSASVEAIASQAEFTPRNVQTQEDRVKSVSAIKLRLAKS
jgi:HlyD family secretion protein